VGCVFSWAEEHVQLGRGLCVLGQPQLGGQDTRLTQPLPAVLLLLLLLLATPPPPRPPQSHHCVPHPQAGGDVWPRRVLPAHDQPVDRARSQDG
jgi:hypothetical protein